MKAYALCNLEHKMVALTPGDFWDKFKDRRRPVFCEDCGARFDKDNTEGISVIYHCLGCEGNGMMFQLCSRCGQQRRQGSQPKHMEQPYEQAKRFFFYQYWTASPVYRFFTDFFSWQEASMDKAHDVEETFKEMLQMSRDEEDLDRAADMLKNTLVGLARKLGMQRVRKEIGTIRTYAGCLIEDLRVVTVSTEDDLDQLNSVLDEGCMITEPIKIAGEFLTAGWICLNLQDSTPCALEFEHGSDITAKAAIEELKEKGCLFQREGQQAQESESYSDVACDWDQFAEQADIKKLAALANKTCHCDSEFVFESEEALLKHFEGTNHDIMD